MKIEIRRNQTITVSCTCKPLDGKSLLDLFPKMPEEYARKQAEYDERRRRAEERIWKAIEESDIQIRDCSGEIVRRDTHEICWERTSEEQLEDGIFRVGLRPYIQPIKSELMP